MTEEEAREILWGEVQEQLSDVLGQIELSLETWMEDNTLGIEVAMSYQGSELQRASTQVSLAEMYVRGQRSLANHAETGGLYISNF